MEIIFLFIANIYDFKYRIIPNYISLLLILVGLFFYNSLHLSGIMVSVFILLVCMKYENYKGGGDIKLIGAIGLVKGFTYTFWLFYFSELLLIAFRLITKNRKALPYAPFLFLTSIVIYFL